MMLPPQQNTARVDDSPHVCHARGMTVAKIPNSMPRPDSSARMRDRRQRLRRRNAAVRQQWPWCEPL